MVVHDDDVLAYEYFRDGRRIDRYNSMPDYFEDVSEKERSSLRGGPERLVHLGARPGDVRGGLRAARLASQPALTRVLRLRPAPGIRRCSAPQRRPPAQRVPPRARGGPTASRAGTACVHVPDLSREQARIGQADAALEDEKRRLIVEGGSLPSAAAEWAGTALRPGCARRRTAAASSSPGLAHADHKEEHCPLERHGPIWLAGWSPTPWAIGRHVYGLELSRLAGTLPWPTRPATGRPRSGTSARIASSPTCPRSTRSPASVPADESADGFSVSSECDEGRVILTPTDGGPSWTIPLPDAKLAAVHPTGSWLARVDGHARALGRGSRLRPYPPAPATSVAGTWRASRRVGCGSSCRRRWPRSI